MAKLTNKQNVENILLRKRLRIWILIFGVITIILALLALVSNIFAEIPDVSFLFALISWLLVRFLTSYRNKIEINRNKELEDIDKLRKNIKSTKKSKKKQ